MHFRSPKLTSVDARFGMQRNEKKALEQMYFPSSRNPLTPLVWIDDCMGLDVSGSGHDFGSGAMPGVHM